MSPDVFGRVHLGYLVVETDKFSDWRRFGRDAIGMHLDDSLPDVLRFRIDDNACRFLLRRGPAEDTTALGWEVDDDYCFEIIEAALVQAGADIKHVVRTRIFLTDMSRWKEAGEVHGEIFKEIEPATSFLGTSALINDGWLVEIEADAVVARG